MLSFVLFCKQNEPRRPILFLVAVTLFHKVVIFSVLIKKILLFTRIVFTIGILSAAFHFLIPNDVLVSNVQTT